MPDIYDGYVYKDVLEAQEARRAVNKITSLFFYELNRLQINQFLLTADEMGIAAAEDAFSIVPDLGNEDLEFRRWRVINRNITKPPYTYRYLAQRLDEMYSGNYTMQRDLNAHTLTIKLGYGFEGSKASRAHLQDTRQLLQRLLPANLAYELYLHYLLIRDIHGMKLSDLQSHQIQDFTFSVTIPYTNYDKEFTALTGIDLISGVYDEEKGRLEI